MRASLLTSVFVLLTSTFATGCGASAPMAAPSSPHADSAPSMGAAPTAPSADVSSSLDQSSAGMARPSAAPTQGPAPASAKTETAASHASTKDKESAPEVAQALGIIYTGTVAIRAKREEFPKTIDKVVDLAESLGGAITGRTDQSVTVRVPSQAFRKAMSGIEDVGIVENRNVTAQDVSEEMHDLEVRLQNMRATRKRLEDFLAKATNITDTLTVERELERVALEIDRIEGRLTFLKANTTFSHITVNLLEKPKDIVPVVEVKTPPPPQPQRKLVDVPAPWFNSVGIDQLLEVH